MEKHRDYGVLITITISKTIQFGERAHQILLAAAPDPRICPVRAIMSLVPMYGPEYVKPDTPFCAPEEIRVLGLAALPP